MEGIGYIKKVAMLIGVLMLSLLILIGCSSTENTGSNINQTTQKEQSNEADSKVIDIKFATVGNEVHPYTIMAEKFKELVEDKSNGEIKVTIFPNGQLGGDREVVEGVQLGTIQMTAVSADGAIPAWVPELQILSIPYLFRDTEHAYKVLDGEIGKELGELMEAQGMKNLGFCELGWRHFTNSVREVKDAADMEGLKLRVQEAKIWFSLTDALGAIAQPMPLTEVYTALQQGVIDGQENPPGTIRSLNFHEVQKYLTLDGHTYAAGSVMINPNFFNNMSPEQQEWVQESVSEAIVQQRQIVSERASEDIEYLEKEGKMVVTVPNRDSFVEATLDIPSKVRDIVPEELIERVKAVQ